MKPPREHLTTLEDWLIWKAKCSIEGCPADTAVRLARFGRIRLKTALYQLDNPDSPPSLAPDSGEKGAPDISHWLRIEAFLLAGHVALEGPTPAKRYKDRLLEFAGSSRSAFEGCLTMIVKRDMARRLAYEEGEHLRGKNGIVNAYAVSRDDDERNEETEATPGALIPAHYSEPATEADKKKIDLVALQTVSTFILSLSKDERVILVFDLLGIPQRVAIENKLIRVQKTSASEKLQAVRCRIAALKWPFEPDLAEENMLFNAFAAELVQWAEGPENADLACYTDQAESPS